VEPRSRLAGYVVGIVLAIPLLLLALFFAGYLGTVVLAVAAAITALCAGVAWTARRRAEPSQPV
jgi:ABC-type dipeptide/oligopeptide/nickel transport system permease subunit